MNPHNVYLASSYDRIKELNEYKRDLSDIGFIITSRWLQRHYKLDINIQIEETGLNNDEAIHFAAEDLEDIYRSDIIILFSSICKTQYSKGGHNVELGIGLALNKHIYIVGPIENIFYNRVTNRFDTWYDCLSYLKYYKGINTKNG